MSGVQIQICLAFPQGLNKPLPGAKRVPGELDFSLAYQHTTFQFLKQIGKVRLRANGKLIFLYLLQKVRYHHQLTLCHYVVSG
jgi:hypothetical protein